jgi:ribosomal-protein-alanine N-acetyltransferase
MPPSLTPPDPPLRDGDLRLRPWRLEDADAIVSACSDPEIVRFVPVPVPYTSADARAYIENTFAAWHAGATASFAVVDDATDAPIGSISVRVGEGNRAIVGYWIAPHVRRRGVATRAVRLVTSWALDALQPQRVELFTDPENVASQLVAERAGYRREGVLRNYFAFRGQPRDAVMFSFTASEVAAAPAPPRPGAPSPAELPAGLVAPGAVDAPWTDLLSLDELFDGAMLRASRGDLDLIVAIVPGGLVVTEDRCPHMAAPLSIGSLDGCVVACPLHHGRFDLCTGETVQMPTTGGLDAEGVYHGPWSPSGGPPKVDPPSSKVEARRLTRVRRLRFYPVRVVGDRIQVRVPQT